MSKLSDKLKELKEARAAYHEKSAGLTAEETRAEILKFKELQTEIQAILTEDAIDCEATVNDDGTENEAHRPIGIFHDGTPYPFEIGDPVTRDRRVRAATLEDAVERWNAGEYLPPRKPETVEATHRDATGEVKSQKTVKLKRA